LNLDRAIFNNYVSVTDNTTVSVVPTNHDIVAAVSGRAVMRYSDDGTKIRTCKLECEHPIVTTKEALRALRIVTQYYDTHGCNEKLDVSLFSGEKELQRLLSSCTKQMNITFELIENNV
jgi:hypothetical protein